MKGNDMKKLNVAGILLGIVVVTAFAVLAIGGSTLPGWAAVTALAVFVAGMFGEWVIDSRKRKLSAQIQASAPEVREMATIVSRRVCHRYHMGPRGGHVSSNDSWCLSFETTQHGTVELPVPWDVWEKYPDGVRGELRYKGTQFIRFVKR